MKIKIGTAEEALLRTRAPQLLWEIDTEFGFFNATYFPAQSRWGISRSVKSKKDKERDPFGHLCPISEAVTDEEDISVIRAKSVSAFHSYALLPIRMVDDQVRGR